MKRFLIERAITGASELTTADLAAIAVKSTTVMATLGVPYRWITSYVAGDRIYCLHEAEDAEAVREHSRRGGFPVTTITEVTNEFGPHTADLTVTRG